MGPKIKKTTAVLVSLLMLMGTFTSAVIAATPDDDRAGLQKGEFIFAPHTYTEGDLTDIYYYTDEVFSGSAIDYNEHLATMSMILASASISSQDPDAEYVDKSRNLSHLFREWGFMGFDVNEYYMEKPDEQTMGAGAAYKVIGEGEEAITVLAIIPRSAGYEKEWAGNFTVGKDGLHEGFETGRDIVLDFAKEYVKENGYRFEGTIKLWTVGYSRGAGVANLLAAYLDDNSDALGIEIKKENIFAYTFGTPSNVQYADETEKAALENDYQNIHNGYSAYDIVTYAPFKNWNFTYYGTTKLFDVQNAEKKAEMLTFLEKTNKTIYDIYTAEDSASDPDNFKALMLEIQNDEFGLGVKLVAADPEYGIPTTQQEFLDSRIAFLVENLVPNREVYVDGRYQYALQRLTSLYFGLDAEQGGLLFGGMSQDAMALAAVYYCYFVSDFYLEKGISLAFIASALIDSLPMIEQYLVAADYSEDTEMPEWFAFASAFIQTEEYEQLKSLLPLVASGMPVTDDKIIEIKETIKNFAVGMTAKVLGSGVAALTLEESEKEELMSTMTSTDVAAPLTEFFAYLLLGTEEGVVSPFDPSNKHIALAVTFLANAGRYMRVHNNEIILSWLRAEDSYYENVDWHIHETVTMYDQNGHWEKCDCGYKGETKAHSFYEWKTVLADDGKKEIMTRDCPCGYEETKEISDTSGLAGSFVTQLGPMTIILISIGSAAAIAAIVAAVVISERRKIKK